MCALASLSSVAHSQLVVLPVQQVGRPALFDGQRPIMGPAGPAMPPSDSGGPPSNPGGSPGAGTVILSDVMGRDRSINIFAGFTRDIESIARRLDDSSKNSTVLAPLNSAIEKLPRKPWEDPRDYGAFGANAYEGEDGQERAQRNLRRFVESHIVPVSPWAENQKARPIGSDSDIWWEEKDGVKVVRLRVDV